MAQPCEGRGQGRRMKTILCCFAFSWVILSSRASASAPALVSARNSSILMEATQRGILPDSASPKIPTQARALTEKEAAENPPSGPYFVVPPATHVTTRAGQTAALTCIVRQLGDRKVSWIRGRDLHVLSSGLVAFSSDSRVSVANNGDAWTLTVRYTQPRDAGEYACQVNAQPRMATWFSLTVVEARAVILGMERMYVQSGSTVALECVIREDLLIPGLVLWYQDDRLVERGSRRVTIDTSVGNETRSILTVASADPKDSGNYSCWPSAGRPDSVLVHVIQGDPPAAMQHGNSASGFSTSLLNPYYSLSLLFLLT